MTKRVSVLDRYYGKVQEKKGDWINFLALLALGFMSILVSLIFMNVWTMVFFAFMTFLISGCLIIRRITKWLS